MSMSACAFMPDEQQDDDVVNVLMDQPEYPQAETLTDVATPAQWWQLFNDDLLTRLEGEAFASNLDLMSAISATEQSQAALGLTQSAQGIQAGLSASYDRSRISEHSRMAMLGAPAEPNNYWTLGAAASWELDLWGHLSSLTDAAVQRLRASEAAQQMVRVSLSADVARTYLLLRGSQQQLALASENRDIAQALLDLQLSRVRNGVATDYQTATARAAVASAEAVLPALEDQRSVLMNRLARLLGKAPGVLNKTLLDAQPIPSMPGSIPVGVPSELALRRPDIIQADAQLHAAVADVAAAKADFYPRISLNASAGTEAFDFSDMGSWGSRTYSVGPSFYLPIFQGGRLRHMLELTKARHQSAAIDYQRTVLNAWHEVADAFNSYDSEAQRYQSLLLARQETDKALQSAQRSWKEGHASKMTVLQARQLQLQAKLALNDSATASALSVVALYRALGGGWQLTDEQTQTMAAAQSAEPLAGPAGDKASDQKADDTAVPASGPAIKQGPLNYLNPPEGWDSHE
ncbi:efflux transporter outer membrane subunit [Thalassolituus sp. UBA1505]|uniref:efflux transporter outer membrane subunit n=1 Tax=Thalassolituus sp. UBA1505 TaxID=1947653 RepID=UPI0025E079B1|nr:efflux transporter outer membrane subunit [Thalassolituus sp. UBA1505]